MIENAIFKDAEAGFFLNGIFNGFTYNVGTANGNSIRLKSQSDNGMMVVDLETITIIDVNDIDITPSTIQEKAAILSGVVSKKKRLIENVTDDAIQRLTDIDGNHWIDDANENSPEALNSNALNFKSSNLNYIDSGIPVLGSQPIYFEAYLIPTVDTFGYLFYCGGDSAANKGIQMRRNPGGRITIFITDSGTGQTQSFTSVSTLNLLEWSKISMMCPNVAGQDFIISINDIPESFTQTVTWTGFSSENFNLGRRLSGLYLNASVAYSIVELNGMGESLLPLSIGAGNNVYDVDFEQQYEVMGTIDGTTWVDGNDFFHYNLNYGFSISNGEKIPASRLNSGLDVLGNPLTNPPVNGHNNAESLLKWPDVDSLKDADNLNLLYDASGIAKELAYSDLIDNPYFRIDTQGNNSKTKALLFSRNLTAEENQYIDEYYANSNN